MKAVGIICEYNPFHLGHLGHIEKTRKELGEDYAVVCVMSGNFVQRGEPAVLRKHRRAEMAVKCGADLVIELPTPYAMSSAEGFAQAGVFLLDCLGVCDAISFGSEFGDLQPLSEAATVIMSNEANNLIIERLAEGLPYALARQRAADALLGVRSSVFQSPNNLLGIEYLKALAKYNSKLRPITVTRTGGAHDSDTGFSASRLRKMLVSGESVSSLMPESAVAVLAEEVNKGYGPVYMSKYETAMLSRLRFISDFSYLPDATEGLDRRIAEFAAVEPTIESMLLKIKTKRYAMSRIRRMLMCACLGITAADACEPPPYIRVLAMNDMGKQLLSAARKASRLPIITKPASVQKLSGRAVDLFYKEAKATDFYTLAFDCEGRAGASEWRQSPYILRERESGRCG
ncbi:MAG: nucleotidyltransferase family protein [Oscillospiraceae bacterium]|nr:nucleotidyltransferase family protein [Oscillospiraceae bacterium]